MERLCVRDMDLSEVVDGYFISLDLTVVMEDINILLIFPHLFRRDLKVCSSIILLLPKMLNHVSVS